MHVLKRLAHDSGSLNCIISSSLFSFCSCLVSCSPDTCRTSFGYLSCSISSPGRILLLLPLTPQLYLQQPSFPRLEALHSISCQYKQLRREHSHSSPPVSFPQTLPILKRNYTGSSCKLHLSSSQCASGTAGCHYCGWQLSLLELINIPGIIWTKSTSNFLCKDSTHYTFLLFIPTIVSLSPFPLSY